jgi:hypothetical protein
MFPIIFHSLKKKNEILNIRDLWIAASRPEWAET